jgi:hypothetical protein
MMQSDHDAKLIDAEYERARDAGELDERFAAEASARRRTAPVSPGTGENMSKAQHTPGPWKIQDAGPNSGNIIRFEIVWTANGTDFHSICEIEDSTVDAKDKKAAARMDEANARLIAAAPALLAACEAATDLFALGVGGVSTSDYTKANADRCIERSRVIMAQLKAAIAAAREGGSQ